MAFRLDLQSFTKIISRQSSWQIEASLRANVPGMWRYAISLSTTTSRKRRLSCSICQLGKWLRTCLLSLCMDHYLRSSGNSLQGSVLIYLFYDSTENQACRSSRKESSQEKVRVKNITFPGFHFSFFIFHFSFFIFHFSFFKFQAYEEKQPRGTRIL